MDTVFAPATAPSRAGVAVIRISGPRARSAAERLTGPLPEEGRSLRLLRDGGGAVLDQALVLVFPEGQSFTGEAVVELQLHGSMAVVRAVMATLGADRELRLAEPGEFTRRAFENGRLDLAQAEALADLIDAETEAQRRQAIGGLGGAVSRLAEDWRERLLGIIALVEAAIDFSEEDLPPDVLSGIGGDLAALESSMAVVLAGAAMAERIREGFEVAIVGAPNVGKSTLVNRIAGREVALASEIAGTTRDVIEVRMDLAGLPVVLLDMAGLRATNDPLEAMGVARARARAEAADLRVHLLEPGGVPLIGLREGDIVLGAKADLGGQEEMPAVSGLTGAGVDGLLAGIRERLSDRAAGAGVLGHERQRLAVERALDHVRVAKGMTGSGPVAEELLSAEVRSAARAVDSLVGRIDVEEVLGAIFGRFCIGK